jgi:hypothetical protein
LLGGGIVLVAAGKWFARNDAAWLSELIAKALGAPRAAAPVNRGAPVIVDEGRVPVSLKVAAIFLAAIGAMARPVSVVGRDLWASLGPAVVGMVVWFSAIGTVDLLVAVRIASPRKRHTLATASRLFSIDGW